MKAKAQLVACPVLWAFGCPCPAGPQDTCLRFGVASGSGGFAWLASVSSCTVSLLLRVSSALLRARLRLQSYHGSHLSDRYTISANFVGGSARENPLLSGAQQGGENIQYLDVRS